MREAQEGLLHQKLAIHLTNKTIHLDLELFINTFRRFKAKSRIYFQKMQGFKKNHVELNLNVIIHIFRTVFYVTGLVQLFAHDCFGTEKVYI